MRTPRAVSVRVVCLLSVFASAAAAQNTFTRTYTFPDSLNMACCTSTQFGLSSSINDTTIPGPVAQISNITVSGTVHVTSPDVTSSASFDWEVFIDSSPSVLTPGQTTGNPAYVISPALTQFHSSQSTYAAVGDSVNFETTYNFGTTVSSSNPGGHVVAASAFPMAVTSGMYIQVFGWSGGVNANLTLSNITVVVTGISGSAGPNSTFAPPSATVVYEGFQGADNNIPVTYNLYPWLGEKVALLTPQNTLDVPTMYKILAGLDAAWKEYEQITQADPSVYAPGTISGRDIIAVVPDASIPSCAACTYVGANGSELTSTYFSVLYNGVMTSDQYDQVMFYEFGRNFWFYNNQLTTLGAFSTGFAIANRFISLDRAGLQGGPYDGLTFAQFQQSDMIDFLNSYLDNPSYTWQNTLLTGQAPPSTVGWSIEDLAGAMLYRLYDDFGFAAYQAFWQALLKLPTANTPDNSVQNFLSAAMTATNQNYGFLFKGAYSAPAVNLCSLTLGSSGTTLGAQPVTNSIGFTTSRDYCEWTASVSGSSWVHLAITSGTGSGSLTYSVDANATGQPRSAVIELSGEGFTIVQNATPTIPPSSISVVNGATFGNGVAPGSWITIEGQTLALASQIAASSTLPDTLSGVQVLVNGSAIPLDFVSPSQINAQLPYEISAGSAQLVVTNYGVASTPVTFAVSATSPGIFMSGGFAVAENVDATTGAVTVNSPKNPVPPGSYIVLYLTGQGLLNNPILTGAAAPNLPLSSPVANASVQIGGTEVPLLFLGMTPGLVGVCQANIQIPDSMPPGDPSVIVTIGAAASPPALIAIGTSNARP